MPPLTTLTPTSWTALKNIQLKSAPSASSGASPACNPPEAKNSRISWLSNASSAQERPVCVRKRYPSAAPGSANSAARLGGALLMPATIAGLAAT
jgi:hypothetical protein